MFDSHARPVLAELLDPNSDEFRHDRLDPYREQWWTIDAVDAVSDAVGTK
jgi:hypothetical protein